MQERPTALVTAAAGAGIGAAIATRLAADGFDVVVTDIHERRAQELAEKLAAEHGREFDHYVLDVTDESRVEAVVSEIASKKGPLDVLVNNAGWSKIEPVAEMSSETWKRCLDVDLNGTFYTMRYALPVMQKNNSGAIVNISSIAAYETSTEHGAAYSAAKAGVLALTRSVALEFGDRGIRCNAVAPGSVRTEVWDHRIANDPGALDRAAVWYPTGRIGSTDDIAAALLFLTSDEAAWITGVTLPVDGGLLAGNLAMARDITAGDGGDAKAEPATA